MPTELDRIMDEDPLNLTPRDYDELIAYYRQQRLSVVAGGPKPKKESGPKKSLAELGLVKAPPPVEPIKRRF